MAEKSKKKPGKRVIVLAAIVVALIAGAAAGYLVLGAPKGGTEEAHVEPAMAQLAVERIVVSVEDAGQTRHLVLDSVIEYESHEKGDGHGEAGADLKPRVRDAFVVYLSGVPAADLRGGDALPRLRAELLKRARAAFGDETPKAVLIQDYVLQ